MSRAKATEVSSPLSLFPFIGVLLSTMGALLVVLIAVSRSAHDAAVRDVAAEREAAQQAPTPPESELDRQKLAEIHQYTARLREVREETERRLRDDQLRLSHVEEQMRRLEDQMAGLGAAAAELEAMDQEHLDDRRQAEREIERLQTLIAESQKTIDTLKKENAAKTRSYAIIPYEGPNGTHRRPLYIECRADEVILQPEGIRLTEQDFLPPIDSGNPLAAALRAAREEIVKEAGGVATKQTEPYPLILVRPDGVFAYYAVRRAIASWDAAFGYEFVGGDWQLDFPPASPRLAKLEHQAIEQARIRRQVLAAAAPRAFRSGGRFGGGFGSGSYSNDDAVGGVWSGGEADAGTAGTSGGPAGSGSSDSPLEYAAGAPRGAGGRESTANGSASSDRGKQGNAVGGLVASSKGRAMGDGIPDAPNAIQSDVLGAAQAGARPAGPDDESAASAGSPASAAGAPSDLAEPGAGAAATAGQGSPTEAGWNMTSGAGASSTVAAPPSSGGVGSAPGSASDMPTLAPSHVHEIQAPITSQDLSQARGSNWAVANRGRAVPVRRSIQVVVHDDRVAVLPDSAEKDQAASNREVLLTGPMRRHVDDIVAAIQAHVEKWGIAGNGLYWRPVLVLQIAPGGQSRARELAQLLKDSGIELRTSTAGGQVSAEPERR